MVHYYLLSSFVDLSSHYKVSPGQPGSAAQTCDILGSLQSPDRNSIAPADFSHRYRSLGSQDSGLRIQGSGEGSSVLLHTPNYHSTRANFNSHTNRTGTSRTCSLLLRFQAESDVWKEPLSLQPLSLSSLSLSSLSGLREVRKYKVPDQNRSG
jgi:hypothetical protein